MVDVYVQEFPLLAWIVRVAMGMIGLAITSIVLYLEIKRRHLPTTRFYSNYLRWTSAVCIWLAPITPLFIILSVIPGFCMIRLIGSAMTFCTQFFFLGLYQLSRLHYCFSNQQLHGKKGYPQWVFVMMIITAIILWTLYLILLIFVDTLPSKCGYTDNGSLFYRYRARAILFDGDSWRDEWLAQIYVWWINAVGISSHSWDLTVLLLYLFKIWKIGKVHKSKENRVWDNVLVILHRIVIITVFYTVCSLFLLILYAILGLNPFLVLSFDLLYFFSILLMMDHNTNIYVVFLHFLRRFHLKYLCFCCYHNMVDRQLEALEIPEEMIQERRRSDAVAGKPEIDRKMSRTMFSNLSKNIVYKSNASAAELSVETVTHVNRE